MHIRDKMLHSVVVAALLAAALPVLNHPLHAQNATAENSPQTASAAAPATALNGGKKIRIQLHWYPQAQFAGYLMAREKGFFREEGLDVEIIWGGANVMPLKELKDGNAEFCTAWMSQAIVSRADDNTPCVLLAQLMPKSSMMLVTRKSSGIDTPSKMTGKKIGAWGGDFSIAPNAFFEKYNIKPVIIMQSSSVLPFVRGVVDVASAMYYNEYHKIKEAGIKPDKLNTFMLADYGLDFPEDGIYTTVNFRKEHPDVCEKMIRAIHKGWKYSFEHKEETIDAIIKEAADKNFITNANHQKWMIDAMEKLIPVKDVKDQPWGYIAPATYENVCEILEHQKLLKNSPPLYEQFYQPADKAAPAADADAHGGEDK